jgi:hypothetical protein
MLVIPIAEQLAWYMHNNELGIYDPTGAGGEIYIDTVPDAPIDAIIIRHTGGTRGLLYGQNEEHDVQIIARSQYPQSALSTALVIRNVLDQPITGRLMPDGNYIVLIYALSDGVAYIGQDKTGCHMYALNYRIIVGGR